MRPDAENIHWGLGGILPFCHNYGKTKCFELTD
jgi:hypothetical protein